MDRMDRYKFRGKSKETGEWVYGCYVECDKNSYICNESMELTITQVEVVKETVGQYTGQNDIFEGDILEYSTNNFLVVTWSNNGWQVIAHRKPNCKSDYFHLRNFGYLSDEEINKVGNIHDNKEMIIK